MTNFFLLAFFLLLGDDLSWFVSVPLSPGLQLGPTNGKTQRKGENGVLGYALPGLLLTGPS